MLLDDARMYHIINENAYSKNPKKICINRLIIAKLFLQKLISIFVEWNQDIEFLGGKKKKKKCR